MVQSIEESLFQAIKKDDTKAFNALMEKAQCGSYRLGRFPVLSLLYLYKSRGLLSEHEEKLLKITKFELLREPVEISKKFSSKAGKCLRLYLNEIVSPLEMLLILDKTRRLKRIYSKTKPSSAVKERLKLIYSIKYSLNVQFEGDNIIIDRRPLSYREKKNIATACLCSLLAVVLTVGVPVTTVALIPKPVEGEIKNLSQIDFSSQDEYILKRDIVLPENYTVDKVNCTINGNGKTLTLSNGAALGELNGKMSDLTIVSCGETIFTSVSENATIENINIKINADITATEATALVAVTNYGTIDGVEVEISGKLNVLAQSTDADNELDFGGIVQNNVNKKGIIKNCTVNYLQFELVGESAANAAFGGIAGINGGYLQDCYVNGEIISDTFDIAGVCAVNNWMISGNVNQANLSQSSSETSWNPISSGIVLSNAYLIENCINLGSISSVSSCEQSDTENEHAVAAAGIAYLNNGGIVGCKNSGTVTVNAENGFSLNAGGITSVAYDDISETVNEGAVTATGNGTAYVGGIAARSCAKISNCISSGDITVTAQTAYTGGILGVSEVAYDYFYNIFVGNANLCISECKINVICEDETFVGGIIGCIREMGFRYIIGVVYFGGGVTNCYFTGECESEISRFGNIVGVCAANIYENNYYYENSGFENNYYLDNNFTAFGATLADNENYETVEDKGATVTTITEIQSSENYMSIKLILNNLEE